MYRIKDDPNTDRESKQDYIDRSKRQINRAEKYLKDNYPANGSEPKLECCIINDLLRIIKNNQHTPHR